MKFVYIFFIALISISLAYIAYSLFSSHQKIREEREFIENNEFGDRKNMKDNLFFFYADWCDHCQKAKPIWNNIKNDNSIKKFGINFVDVNGDDEKNKQLIKYYNVKEYPTVILDKNQKKYIFDANLSSETLMKFFASVYKTSDA